MRIGNVEIDVNDAIEYADIDNIILKRRKNNLLLSDYQVSVLERNGLNYNNYSTINDLLFDIEEVLSNEYDDELDLLSSQLAELSYYKDTKK